MTFNACQNLDYIVLPKLLTRIGKGAFMQCPSLRIVELTKYISEIVGNRIKKADNLRTWSNIKFLDVPIDSFLKYQGGLYITKQCRKPFVNRVG